MMGIANESCEDLRPLSETMENYRVRTSKEGKGKKLWKKVKYQLVEYHMLPGYMRDNEYILGHYRAEWPMKQTLLSIFTIHNETLNVWTHLIGFFLFLALTIYTAMKVPKVVDLYSLKHFPDVLRKADLHKLGEELKTTLPSMNISSWHVVELLYNCLPERFSHGNYTDACVLGVLPGFGSCVREHGSIYDLTAAYMILTQP